LEGRCDTSADVIIVGAGLAGATTAAVLGVAGIRVILVDPRETYPECFKAEKIEADQADLFRKLGLLDILMPVASRIRKVWNARDGRILSTRRLEQYGAYYHDMVNAVRRHLPDEVQVRLSRVEGVTNAPDVQRVTLAGGEELTGRLAVVASGSGGMLHARLGIRKKTIRKEHSFAFGFNIEPVEAPSFSFDAVTYYPNGYATRVAYLSLFRIGLGMRANLFVFRAASDELVRRFLREPREELERSLPRLAESIGQFRVVGRVEGARIDLYQVEGHRRPGLVVIGDAFQSVCPSTGTGLSRVLTDVDVLCSECLPEWLATPGMGVEKINRYYGHSRKLVTDADSLDGAHYLRRLYTDPALPWRLRRIRLNLGMRLSGWPDYLRLTRKLTA
jgi:2-polyprenyl-6-methoxyphenol hydroxylase-like FAD-dependent oxidoreductase